MCYFSPTRWIIILKLFKPCIRIVYVNNYKIKLVSTKAHENLGDLLLCDVVSMKSAEIFYLFYFILWLKPGKVLNKLTTGS